MKSSEIVDEVNLFLNRPWYTNYPIYTWFFRFGQESPHPPNFLRKLCLLPLFIRWKLGTSKIDYGDKIQKKPCLFTFSSGNQAMTAIGSSLFRNAMIISMQKLIQVIKSNTAGFLRIQRQNRKFLKGRIHCEIFLSRHFMKYSFRVIS